MSPPGPPPSEPKKKKSPKKKNKNRFNKPNKPNDHDNTTTAASNLPPTSSTQPPHEYDPTSPPFADAGPSRTNHVADVDTVSNASFESTASHRRRRPRGGRKRKNKLRAVAEDQGLSPEEQLQLEEQQLLEAERQLTGAVDESVAPPHPASVQDERDEQDDYQGGGGAELQLESPPPGAHSVNGVQEAEQPAPPTRFETGIRAFRIQKADPAGGRPIGTRVQTRGIGGQAPSVQQQQQQSHSPKQHHPRHRHAHPHPQQPQPQPQQPQQHAQDSTHPRTQAQVSQPSSGNEGKEVSIKVDLNLEVEILLKAKIKGEIMITFLN